MLRGQERNPFMAESHSREGVLPAQWTASNCSSDGGNLFDVFVVFSDRRRHTQEEEEQVRQQK